MKRTPEILPAAQGEQGHMQRARAARHGKRAPAM